MTPKQNRKARVDRVISQISSTNRTELARHIEQARTNLEENSLQSRAMAVRHADRILGGKDFRSLTADDCQAVVSQFRTIYSRGCLRQRVILFRTHLRYLHGVDDLEKSELIPRSQGRAMEQTMKVKREKEAVVGQVISPDQLEAIVKHLKHRTSAEPAFLLEDRDAAMWRTLRASGFRVGEFVSLNKRYASREVQNGQPCYKLELVEAKDWTDGYVPDLKTGPRTVYVADAATVKALDLWMASHPSKDPDAPLWPQGRSGASLERLNTDGVRKTLALALKWAGLDKMAQQLTPHDFRHTCATEKADLAWGEYQMCHFFGWEIGSRTPGTYVHKRLEKQRERILADAAKLPPTTSQQPQAVEALLGLLRQAVGQMTPAPTG